MGRVLPRCPRAALASRRLFRNWKIPVHSALVQGRQTDRDTQAFCVSQLMAAARHLAAARPAGDGYERVMCLLVWPWLHQSEVAIYYDADYHRGLACEGDTLAPRRLSAALGFDVPPGFVERGVDVTQADDEARTEWWSIGEPAR